jgi:hypothetical protein
MLWHVYAHAFAIDVLRPDVRLISVADLVASVEAWVDVLDWNRLRQRHGRLVRALPHIGRIVPWSPRVQERAGTGASPGAAAAKGRRDSRHDVTTSGAGPHRLWRNAMSLRIWWPLPWWFDVRYGVDGPLRRAWHRLITHPATVLLSALDIGWWKYVRPALAPGTRHVEGEPCEHKP